MLGIAKGIENVSVTNLEPLNFDICENWVWNTERKVYNNVVERHILKTLLSHLNGGSMVIKDVVNVLNNDDIMIGQCNICLIQNLPIW